LNRVDEIIIFDRLTDADLKQIVEIQLARLIKRPRRAKAHAQAHRRRQAPPRPRRLRPGLWRAPVETRHPARTPRPAQLEILAGKFHEGQTITADARDGKIVFN
jgi:ATP-dependent Clp protease ATP-binding subunit ClpB